MPGASTVQNVTQLSYLVAAALFILGLKRMSSPRTARGGIIWAGYGMLVAVFATFFLPDMHNRGLIIAAVVIGVGAAWCPPTPAPPWPRPTRCRARSSIRT